MIKIILLILIYKSILHDCVVLALKYCRQWNVSINVDKSSITVFTKSRSQPVVDIRFGDRSIKQTESFVHLGILY